MDHLIDGPLGDKGEDQTRMLAAQRPENFPDRISDGGAHQLGALAGTLDPQA